MCGRFSLFEEKADLVEKYSVLRDLTGEVVPRWNISPTQQVLAVIEEESERCLANLRWGLVPFWAKDPSIGSRMINARLEGVEESKAYRNAFKKRRCLIPASGFYEWKKLGGGPKSPKQPYFIHFNDDSPMTFAGIWETWSPAGKETIRSCSIITTVPNEAVAFVHDRMPLILGEDQWESWLAPEALDAKEVEELFVPQESGIFKLDPISTRVNSPANEGPDILEPPEKDPASL